MNPDTIYAIDFGTSNSLLAASVEGTALGAIPLEPGKENPEILRSLMYFPKQGEIQFGQSAIDAYVDESAEGRFIRSIKKYLPAQSFSGTQINGEVYTLEDLVGRFLRELKTRADVHFDHDVTQAVLGRPAKFSLDTEKDKLAENRLKKAALAAGFKDIHFLAEPLAAAYQYRHHIKSEKMVLVVDLGGGTSDFTVVKLSPGAFSQKDVLALGGVSVAGDAVDGTIMREKIAPHLGSKVQYKLPMTNNTLDMPAWLKIQLSSPADITLMSKSNIMGFLNEVKKTTVSPADEERMENLFSLINENMGFSIFEKIEQSKRGVCANQNHQFLFDEAGVYIKEDMTYPDFEQWSDSIVSKIFASLDEVISSAQIKSEQIESICCTGGTSKLPAIKKGLESRFGLDKIETFKNFHSVIEGLAQKANELK